ncbi:MAG: hypothetical protein JNM53_14100 [Gemmatimonadetes bacterium]|nr:hypothetical protein [Gemmatimonadota bacterium]
MAQPQQPPPGPLPDAPTARHLGDLARSQTRWGVYLETRPYGSLAQGRLHFVEGSRHKSTGWIFREWTEQEIVDRFSEFSPIELWKILESLG